MKNALRGKPFVVGLLAVASAACAEMPTGPERIGIPETLAFDVNPSAQAATSTLCVAYQRERDTARSSLTSAPKDAVLQAAVSAYNAVIADACQ